MCSSVVQVYAGPQHIPTCFAISIVLPLLNCLLCASFICVLQDNILLWWVSLPQQQTTLKHGVTPGSWELWDLHVCRHTVTCSFSWVWRAQSCFPTSLHLCLCAHRYLLSSQSAMTGTPAHSAQSSLVLRHPVMTANVWLSSSQTTPATPWALHRPCNKQPRWKTTAWFHSRQHGRTGKFGWPDECSSINHWFFSFIAVFQYYTVHSSHVLS